MDDKPTYTYRNITSLRVLCAVYFSTATDSKWHPHSIGFESGINGFGYRQCLKRESLFFIWHSILPHLKPVILSDLTWNHSELFDCSRVCCLILCRSYADTVGEDFITAHLIINSDSRLYSGKDSDSIWSDGGLTNCLYNALCINLQLIRRTRIKCDNRSSFPCFLHDLFPSWCKVSNRYNF